MKNKFKKEIKMRRFQNQNEESLSDLHLRLSEKYLAYRDLADRCLLNPSQISQGDRRVFYLQPESPFLQEPRIQNQFRSDFVRQIGQPPSPKPLTLMADDLHKDYLENVSSRACPSDVKSELANFYKRRQYKLQHKRHKLLLRWAHYCLTSEIVDRVSLRFNPAYAKIQFELENCVKRYQRLEGQDHFRDPMTLRDANASNESSSAYTTVKDQSDDGVSALRADDIDVYLRCVTYEDKITRNIQNWVQKAKWTPMTKRFEIFKSSVEQVQEIRKDSINKQHQKIERIESLASQILETRKYGVKGETEVKSIVKTQHVSKIFSKQKNFRDEIMMTAKSNYEMVPLVLWNELELKIELQRTSTWLDLSGDMEIDDGHPYAHSIVAAFPQKFLDQILMSRFIPYEAVPQSLSMDDFSKDSLQPSEVTRQQSQQRNPNHGCNHGKPQEKKLEFINSAERSLFADFNKGQLDGFPSIKLKKADWIDFICFQPTIDKEQMHQASILSHENNEIDECLRGMLELLKMQNAQNLIEIMEEIAKSHSGKVRSNSKIQEQVEQVEDQDQNQTFVKEESDSFLSVFESCFKLKDNLNQEGDQFDSQTFMKVPEHLLQCAYLLQILRARDFKTKLLYTLNSFRAIQRRLSLELREMGSRDRVLGDAQVLYPTEHAPKNQEASIESKIDGKSSKQTSVYKSYKDDKSSSKEDKSVKNPFKQKSEGMDVINDHMIDINQYRMNNKYMNNLNSTCPVVPRFHATYGQPLGIQEISAEIDLAKTTNLKDVEGKKLLGRADKLFKHVKTGLNLVLDDFGVHVLFDAAVADMIDMEEQILRVCSYYINQAEPILDKNPSNIYFSVDRLRILEEAFEFEQEYQDKKLALIECYMECFDHTCDLLEQQRLIQVVVDEMARRPRFNLKASHFRDSYKLEIECITEKQSLVRSIIESLKKAEYEENQQTRKYLEKTYRLLNDQMDKQWQMEQPENLENELNKREVIQTGKTGTRDFKHNGKKDIDGKTKEKTAEQVQEMDDRIQKEAVDVLKTQQILDPKEFAKFLGMPYSSLQMIMKEHHERDSQVRETIHEHVSFIKIQEGYPQFIYPPTVMQNQIKLARDGGHTDILDFYESLHVMPKVIAAIQGAVLEIFDVHCPDNGLSSTSLELNTIKMLRQALREIESPMESNTQGIERLEDDCILGNSDKMLFYSKELKQSALDDSQSHNPFVISKLDIKSIQNFNFDNFQGYIDDQADIPDNGDVDAARHLKVNRKNFGRFFPKLKEHSVLITIPSMLTLSCNIVEIFRLRSILLKTLYQRSQLFQLYNQQVKLMGRDSMVFFKDKFKFQPSPMAQGNVNFISDGPASDLNIDLAINEFDSSLRSSIDFSEAECFKALMLPLGLEELRIVVQYEQVNLQALILATRTNQILLDNTQRKLCEINFFEKGFTIANPVLDLFEKLQGQNLLPARLQKLPMLEKSDAMKYISANIGPCCYDIIKRKAVQKSKIEELFKNIKNSANENIMTLRHSEEKDKDLLQPKFEVVQRYLRTAKMILCMHFCEDLLARVCNDSIKLQIMQQTNHLRKRANLLPRECAVFDLTKPVSGEVEFAAYACQEDNQPSQQSQSFFVEKEQRIKSFRSIPSNKEVIEIQTDMQKLRDAHFEFFEKLMPDPTQQKSQKQITASDVKIFFQPDQLSLFEQFGPKITQSSQNDLDQADKERLRTIDFQEAFDYEQCGNAIKYLSYFTALVNVFDLEFFMCKLGSSTKALVNVEKMVLSGCSFWEDDADDLFDQESEASEQEDTQRDKSQEPVTDRFEDGGHQPLKNVLATQVAQKMAKDKRQKMQLRQDLETVTERFQQNVKIMQAQEMQTSLKRATKFLNEIHHLKFLTVLSVLSEMQDSFLKDGKGQKEILFIDETIRQLSRVQDIKITYTNGFHVNHAITSLNRIDIESSPSNPDYWSFFQVAQPIIDEEALNPPEFTLLSGIHADSTSDALKFRKSNVPFVGCLNSREYSCLDFALTNLSEPVRKRACQLIANIYQQCKTFINAYQKIEEEEYESNPTVYTQILEDKKWFLKLQLRSRQLRRALMVIISKKPLPLEVQNYQNILQQYNDVANWKIVELVDQMEAKRNSKKEELKVRRVTEKELKEAQVLKTFDSTQAELEVASQELQKFMIQTSIKMFDRENGSLTKVFEMSNIKFQAFIHPQQQFASTVNQKIDARNHLDIINKVGPIQKMFTKIINRSVEIETLASGRGFVISKKDLQECLQDCARTLVKSCEIEMRTRCEFYSMKNQTMQDLLYVKDQQLMSLEFKLQDAKTEIDKIVSTKLFSRGNNLIYELDRANRQLRLLKDSIFLLEKNLTDKIRKCYDRELDETKVQLEDIRIKFLEYQESISAQIKAHVREEVNSIDGVMKLTAERFKDLDRKTNQQLNEIQEIKKDFKNKQRKTLSKEPGSQNNMRQNLREADPKIREEFENMKLQELEARQEVLHLQECLRKQRLLTMLKKVLQEEKHREKIQDLQSQLSDNKSIWTQLDEIKLREKTVQNQFKDAQKLVEQQDRVIKKLREELKTERQENHKLLQYKSTKSKRLDELESRAREFEVLHSVSLDKIITLLDKKETQINQLQGSENSLIEKLKHDQRMSSQEIQKATQRTEAEISLKIDAITKLETLRDDIDKDQENSLQFWKDQCRNLIKFVHQTNKNQQAQKDQSLLQQQENFHLQIQENLEQFESERLQKDLRDSKVYQNISRVTQPINRDISDQTFDRKQDFSKQLSKRDKAATSVPLRRNMVIKAPQNETPYSGQSQFLETKILKEAFSSANSKRNAASGLKSSTMAGEHHNVFNTQTNFQGKHMSLNQLRQINQSSLPSLTKMNESLLGSTIRKKVPLKDPIALSNKTTCLTRTMIKSSMQQYNQRALDRINQPIPTMTVPNLRQTTSQMSINSLNNLTASQFKKSKKQQDAILKQTNLSSNQLKQSREKQNVFASLQNSHSLMQNYQNGPMMLLSAGEDAKETTQHFHETSMNHKDSLVDLKSTDREQLNTSCSKPDLDSKQP